MSEGLLPATVHGSPRSIGRGRALWLLGLICMASVLLALGGETARLALRYERGAVLAGEYWRLLTGHLIHGTTAHLLLNMAGLGLIAGLFPRDYSLGQWLFIVLLSMVAIDVGFVLFEPQLHWYVGLSGVLHGALAAGAIGWWRHETKLLAAALSLVLVGKLAWEQLHGALPFSGDIPVIVNAHLYGALGGAAAGLAIWLKAQDWSGRSRPL